MGEIWEGEEVACARDVSRLNFWSEMLGVLSLFVPYVYVLFHSFIFRLASFLLFSYTFESYQQLIRLGDVDNSSDAKKAATNCVATCKRQASR